MPVVSKRLRYFVVFSCVLHGCCLSLWPVDVASYTTVLENYLPNLPVLLCLFSARFVSKEREREL